MPGTLRDTSYAEEMNVVLGMTTRWVAAAIKSQYDVAMNPNIASTYEFIEKEDTVTVRSGDREYMLQTQIWECDCEFALTMKLPCRHAMVFKQRSGSPFFIPFAAIAYRYVHVSSRFHTGICELPMFSWILLKPVVFFDVVIAVDGTVRVAFPPKVCQKSRSHSWPRCLSPKNPPTPKRRRKSIVVHSRHSAVSVAN